MHGSPQLRVHRDQRFINFGFFAALDGSRSIDDSPHGQLRLTYISPDGSEVPLNLTNQVSTREVDELHALWGGEACPYTEPLPE